VKLVRLSNVRIPAAAPMAKPCQVSAKGAIQAWCQVGRAAMRMTVRAMAMARAGSAVSFHITMPIMASARQMTSKGRYFFSRLQ
jgi:hypothetical protein